MRSRVLIALGVALAATVLVTSAAQARSARLPALAPHARDGLTRALAAGELTEAEYALQRARSLFHRGAVAARYGSVARPDSRDATLLLRDLALRAQGLPPAERAQAERLLARPDDGAADVQGAGYSVPSRVDCTAHFCFHWVDTTQDAPAPADGDGDGIPDYVQLTEATLEHVWSTEVDTLGYRPPKSDASSPNHGLDGRVDVYLADVGADGLYGYCTTDDPNVTSSYAYGDVSAYCVLDNDFSPTQFPGSTTPVQALEVTAAHEFFHAIQFGYDIFEDGWLMEGTAVWMEDEVYNDVNDNYQYLRSSALTRPGIPIDLAVRDFSSPLAGFQYGAFVFWRFLSEEFGTPDVIRRVWEFADDSPAGPDQYSLQAASSMLQERGTTFGATFARFAAANAFPVDFYTEGAAYPRPALALRPLAATGRRAATGEKRLDHLTSWYVEFRPSAADGPKARLRVTLDLPARNRGSEASLLVVLRSGAVKRFPVALDAAGHGVRAVPFARSQVASVVLVLSNASERFLCWRSTPVSCQGTPLDDALLYRYGARVTG